MNLHRWNEITVEPMGEGITRQVIHTERVTISRLVLTRGSVVQWHNHENVQISTVERGRLLFLFPEGKEQIVAMGESLEIPPNVPHRVEALEDSVALDIFSPRRDDWLRGDDAYLRGR